MTGVYVVLGGTDPNHADCATERVSSIWALEGAERYVAYLFLVAVKTARNLVRRSAMLFTMNKYLGCSGSSVHDEMVSDVAPGSF